MDKQLAITPDLFSPDWFWVESAHNDGECYLVDVAYLEEGHRVPHEACACIEYMAKGNVCKHIKAVRQHLYITEHWNELESGDVIDVRFILGETPHPCLSECLSD